MVYMIPIDEHFDPLQLIEVVQCIVYSIVLEHIFGILLRDVFSPPRPTAQTIRHESQHQEVHDGYHLYRFDEFDAPKDNRL